jgi:hypothetical protein
MPQLSLKSNSLSLDRRSFIGDSEAWNPRGYERAGHQRRPEVGSAGRNPPLDDDAKTKAVLAICYFRRECRGLRSNDTPSPEPPSLVNAIPARSSAFRIAWTASLDTCRRSFSKSTTVESPRPAASASSDCVMSIKARAALHCAGVMASTIFVDNAPETAYQ